MSSALNPGGASELNAEIDLWRLAAGLGCFLFGMHQLEQSLKHLTGRPFKKFLREHTSHPLKGVLAGALTDGGLQSSSVVSLIVLAFVGTGIISLASAIGIVFGSNLGTTATGWIVATIGFKLDIEVLSLPLIALGGLGVVWSRSGSRDQRIQPPGCGAGVDAAGARVHEVRRNQRDGAFRSGDTRRLSAHCLSCWSGCS